ncbi:hypothetical protein MMC07_008882 [Pseudocyphellaria aurata]|nr:hypothetical protein [Pseudocyphellaria aurata]
MRYSSAIVASAALVAGASAWDNVTYTTEIVTAYTTFCPSPTAITHGTHTYTVTEATTLTITNCPCTLTKPVYTAPIVYCSTCPHTSPSGPVVTPVASVPVVSVPTSEVPVVTPEASVPVVGTTTPGVVPVPVPSVPSVPSVPEAPSSVPVPNAPVATPYVNSTGPAPVGTGSPAPSAGVPGTTSPLEFKGAANKAYAASGLSLAGLVGLAAMLL